MYFSPGDLYRRRWYVPPPVVCTAALPEAGKGKGQAVAAVGENITIRRFARWEVGVV